MERWCPAVMWITCPRWRRPGSNPPAKRIRSSPEVFEPARRQLGVSHRVLDVAVAEVSLQRSRIVAFVGQRKTTGVAQHVRMSRKAQLGLDTSALHHARPGWYEFPGYPPIPPELNRNLDPSNFGGG